MYSRNCVDAHVRMANAALLSRARYVSEFPFRVALGAFFWRVYKEIRDKVSLGRASDVYETYA